MRDTSSRLRWAALSLVVACTAAAVVLVGSRLAESQGQPGDGPSRTRVPVDLMPPPPVEPTRAPVTEVEIAGKVVQLPPGMTGGKVLSIPMPPGVREMIRLEYRSEGNTGPLSELVLDQDGRILRGNILREHRSVFEPIIAVALPAVTPAPSILTVAGIDLHLPAGMEVLEAIGGGGWILVFQPDPLSSKSSSVTLDDLGNVVRSNILPEHQAAFQGVLDALRPAP